MQEFSYTSPMQVPHLSKIILNSGMGEALLNARAMESATRDLTLISGQRPITNRAKKSIANFKLREGMEIGCMTTLRRAYMWHFLDRLISVALPRVRDFRGLSRRGFDGHGNYSLGVREQIIFPEVDYDKVERITGLNVTMVTSAKNDAEGKALLTHLGVPFQS